MSTETCLNLELPHPKYDIVYTRIEKSLTILTGTSITLIYASASAGSALFIAGPVTSDSYALDRITLFSKIDETLAAGGTELLIQGGLHPDLNLDFFTGMLRDIKTRYDIHIRSLSPPEIVHLSL